MRDSTDDPLDNMEPGDFVIAVNNLGNVEIHMGVEEGKVAFCEFSPESGFEISQVLAEACRKGVRQRRTACSELMRDAESILKSIDMRVKANG